MKHFSFKRSSDTAKSPIDPKLEARIQTIGKEYLAQAKECKSGLLSAQFWSDKLMDWAMKDPGFKVQLFRFVDTFPTLKTPDIVHEHLVDYLTQPDVTPPPFLRAGLKAGGVMKGTLTKTVSSQITAMAEKFIAGTDAESALPKLKKLWDQDMAFGVDLLGEACVSNAEAEMYKNKYLDLIENLPETVGAWPSKSQLETDHLGEVPRTNVSIKVSSLHPRTDPIDSEGAIKALQARLRPILEAAAKRGVFINFDMEHHAVKDLTLELFMRCCEEIDFEAGIAIQAYLRSGDADAKRIIEWSQRTGRQVTVRLVKGAYWDYETIHAEQMGWPVPVWSQKFDTDACFERMTRAFIKATPKKADAGGVKLALGSHNVRSIAVALALLEAEGLPENAIELQMLHGMAEQLKSVAVKRKLRLREYVPVGEMIPGMAYFVRRLLENTSNESWLKAGFLDDQSTDILLASPHQETKKDPGIERIARAPERHELAPAVPGVGNERPFFTEPTRDFSDPKQRKHFAEAVQAAKVPEVKNDATVEQASAAIDRLEAYFPTWRDTDPRERANMLCRAADAMRARRDELAGIIVKENGKDWRDADADVCEAIDFMEYYARKAVPLFEYERMGKFIGELDQQFYQARGVAAVISPWNFPLAICTGMTTAALVTGNCAVVKPAEQTPGIAKIMADILWKAGVPKDALAFLPGEGESVGAALVRDPRIATIAFTGSKAVGLDIIKEAGITPEQAFVKKAICEMGGKNAIIVDTSADLDEAVIGVRNSAFHFQGQKCSACSRVIVLESTYDEFMERLIASTRSLVIGDPADPGTEIGPVIDAEAKAKIDEYIAIGKTEGKLELGMEIPEGLETKVGMPYVGPHIFSGIKSSDRLAREEIFGPVLAVIKVKTFEEALEVANDSPYKLTGGIFSRMPAHIEATRQRFRVGNLYINRTCTGALVGRQPFGGFGMSGIGSKAGGKDYLLQFVDPRAISENTMRRGFAPGL